jgi:hypothetical protein
MRVFICLIVLLAILGFVASTCPSSDYDKVDCGYVGITQSGCESKGCCWASSSVSGIPWCFYQAGAATSCFGYAVSKLFYPLKKI